MFKIQKKGVVSITSLSLIILLLVSMFILTYDYYNSSKVEFQIEIKKQETLNSLSSFRSEILNLVVMNDSSLSYLNGLDSEEITIYIDNRTLMGQQIYEYENIRVNISTFGVKFCDTYSFSPRISTTFIYNGSCISKN